MALFKTTVARRRRVEAVLRRSLPKCVRRWQSAGMVHRQIPRDERRSWRNRDSTMDRCQPGGRYRPDNDGRSAEGGSTPEAFPTLRLTCRIPHVAGVNARRITDTTARGFPVSFAERPGHRRFHFNPQASSSFQRLERLQSDKVGLPGMPEAESRRRSGNGESAVFGIASMSSDEEHPDDSGRGRRSGRIDRPGSAATFGRRRTELD